MSETMREMFEGEKRRLEADVRSIVAMNGQLVAEGDALAAENAALREALGATRDWWNLGHESCEWCMSRRGEHLPNCPGPLVEAALAVPPSAHVARFQAAERVAELFQPAVNAREMWEAVNAWRALRGGDGASGVG